MAKDWYVVWCSSGRERETVSKLKRLDGIHRVLFLTSAILERRGGKWGVRDRALFPGYIFVWCEMSVTLYYQVRGIPHVHRWLGNSNGTPEAVPADEMDNILKAWSYLQAGGDPQEFLQDVHISGRQRRGYGVLRIHGKAYRISFSLAQAAKQ